MGLRLRRRASSPSRTRKTCESLSSAATILASTSSCCAEGSKTDPKLEVPVLDVRLAPQGRLEDHGLEPGLVHLVHVLVAVAPVGQERLDGGRDRVDEREDVAQPDEIRRLVSPIGLVLFLSGVPKRYLLLVVEPLLVVRAPASIKYPLPEPPPHPPEILRIGLPFGVREVANEMRMVRDEPVPHVENILDLVLEHIPRHPQILLVLLAKEYRLLQEIQLLEPQRRSGHTRRPILVPGYLSTPLSHPALLRFACPLTPVY